MKRLHFDYCMEIRYSADVSWCCYTIKCIPKDNDRQKISNTWIDMIPETKKEWATDSHGNRYVYGSNEIPHSYFKYHIKGDAECGCADYESVVSKTEEMIYRHSHGLTAAGDKLREYHGFIRKEYPSFDEMRPLDKARLIMEKLNGYLIYEKGSTGIGTGAEEAFTNKKGVCQDYSHIMISLLILSGCAARYVTGLIIGEGESHAWVEVADGGKWYGLDPTNNIMVQDSHIKIGCGRDATECQINRGIMHGGGMQTQDIYVKVREIGPGQSIMKRGALF
ncbi:MAG: transglutaminase family protein [Butyrivibrio sp.]|nr:transglutaminase family protein [Butyrivibrio sp.]MCR4637091.1 transglutaminase family protein [Butyrivibrio sp.]